MMCGGLKEAKEATEEIQQICEQLREDMVGKAGYDFEEFVAISYSSQVVAGTNYFIKIKTGCSDFIHARVYKPLPGQGDLQLHSLQTGKSQEEAISHF